MELIPVRPDDMDALRGLVAVERECAVLDRPWDRPLTPYREQQELLHGYEGEGGEAFLIRVEDADVGVVALYTTEYDNLDQAWITLAVRPDLRGQGIAGRAVPLVEDECRRRGRDLVLLFGWESDALRRLALAAGYQERSVEARRLLRLEGTPAELERFRSLFEQSASAARDYELLRISGRTPEELLPALLSVTEAINDAPTDDLEVEDEVFDLDRIRAHETAQLSSGCRLLRLVARHRESGALVGHTVVVVDTEQPAWAIQYDTAVVPEHRGHRLGMLLKSAMVLWLAEREPQVRLVMTDNAESNAPMIAVNEELGMRLVGRQPLFQRRLGPG